MATSRQPTKSTIRPIPNRTALLSDSPGGTRSDGTRRDGTRRDGTRRDGTSPGGTRSDGTRSDPRIERTQALLFATLFDLVQRQRWDQITVQDIIDTARVSRSTFYAHFDNKLDVLTSGIGPVVATLTVGEPGQPPDLLSLFNHANDMAPLFRALLDQPVLGEIVEQFHRACVHAWATYFDDSTESMRVEFLAGATIAVLRAYVSSQRRQPPTRAAAEFSRLIKPLLGQRSRASGGAH